MKMKGDENETNKVMQTRLDSFCFSAATVKSRGRKRKRKKIKQTG
jgi:hypothetical protein